MVEIVTEEVRKRGRPPKPLDEVTSTLLITGEATMSQLAQLFETDAKTLPRRLKGIRQSGTRSGTSVYKIKEAATRLVKPGYSIEHYIMRMHPNEMPMGLHKEFWAGRRSRQDYEVRAGDLWPTSEIIEAFGEAWKDARMTILLFTETVEREAGITDAQRKVLRRLCDGLLDDIRKALVEKFSNYEPSAGLERLSSSDGMGPIPDGDGILQAEGDSEDPDDL